MYNNSVNLKRSGLKGVGKDSDKIQCMLTSVSPCSHETLVSRDDVYSLPAPPSQVTLPRNVHWGLMFKIEDIFKNY